MARAALESPARATVAFSTLTTRLRPGPRFLLTFATLAALAAPYGLPDASGLQTEPVRLLVQAFASLGPAIGLALAGCALYAALALPVPPRHVRRLVVGSLLGVALARTLVSIAGVGGGLTAAFVAATPAGSRVERSTEFPSLAAGTFTRVDARLDLRGNQLPVHFFNDASRFNLAPDVRPTRDHLAFSVQWAGLLRVPVDGTYAFRATAAGESALWIGDTRLLGTPAGTTVSVAAGQAPLLAGLHPIRVLYQRPEARAPRFTLEWQAPGGAFQPVGGTSVVHGAQGFLTPETRQWVRSGLEWALVAVIVGWLTFGLVSIGRRRTGWRRAALGALPLLFLGYGVAQYAGIADRTTILSGGDDWLTHESLARDILLNGPLMTGGVAQVGPYYAQPLYPYALAVAHLLTGEGLLGPLALQYAGIGFTALFLALLGTRLFGVTGGVAGLALFLAFLQQEHLRVARSLLNENLYSPLVAASLLALVALAQQRRVAVPASLVTGALLGLTALTRSQLLLYVPFALLLLAWCWWRPGQRRRIAVGLAALVLGLAATIAPATLRNWVVSGQVVLIASSAGNNLLAGHQLPAELNLDGIRTDPLYNALRLDAPTRTVLELLRQDPAGYFATWLPNGAHSVGLTGVRRGDGSVYWGFLGTFLLYLLAFLLPRVRRRDVWLLHLFVVTHLVVMMAFAADTYGFRLVVPMYGAVCVVAAQLPLALVQWLVKGRAVAYRRRVPAWAGAAAATIAVLWLGRGLVEAWPERDLAYHGLNGAVGVAAAAGREADAEVLYVASADNTPRRFGSSNLPGLAYPRVKWFDPATSLPLPRAGSGRAAYALHEVVRLPDPALAPAQCLGAGGVFTLPEVEARCVSAAGSGLGTLNAQYGDLLRVEWVQVPQSVTAGESLPVRLLWEMTAPTGEPYQAFVHLFDESDASVLWGNGTARLYPPGAWEAGERVLSVLRVPTDAMALPGAYRAALGWSRQTDGAALTGRWASGSADRVPIGSVTFELARTPAPAARVPAGFGPPREELRGGGVSLEAVRLPSAPLRPGERLSVGLIWEADAAVDARQVRLSLLAEGGTPVQEATLPLFGGRLDPALLTPGSRLRDEQAMVLSPRLPGGALALQVAVLDGGGRVLTTSQVGTMRAEGRERRFAPGTPPAVDRSAELGEQVALVGYTLEPERVRAGETVTLTLTWRALAEMPVAYKVFTQVLNQSQDGVVAQRDGEPQDGTAPTTGWLPGEVIEDRYRIAIPADTAAGAYPVQVGLYDPRSGDRLTRPDGENRVLLQTRLQVTAR